MSYKGSIDHYASQAVLITNSSGHNALAMNDTGMNRVVTTKSEVSYGTRGTQQAATRYIGS